MKAKGSKAKRRVDPMWPANVPIVPTHYCFDDALRFVEFIEPELLQMMQRNARIVHGIVRTNSGELYSHGWFECNARDMFEQVQLEPGDPVEPRVIWQGGEALVPGPLTKIASEPEPVPTVDKRPVFYAIQAEPFYAHVVQSSRYTLHMAAELVRMYGTSGPWRDDYKQHLADGSRDLGVISLQRIVCIIDVRNMVALFSRPPLPDITGSA